MANLATTYHSQGRYEEAEKLQMQVIETSKVKLGDHHPHTLACIGNLAFILGDQGRLQDSEKLEEQVMESSKKTLGDDHPDTLASMTNLAVTYNDQGRWQEAEIVVRRGDPAEAINAQRLAEMENDSNLPTTTPSDKPSPSYYDEDDEDMEADGENRLDASTKVTLALTNGVSKSHGLTHCRGSVTAIGKTRGRKNLKDYPSSWGFDKCQMTLKKRIMAIFASMAGVAGLRKI
ncbi:Kinesin light chain [Beauveria bassiana]|nr:Kinesin light chain [Beauveria bassiana]KAH8713600.1 Kinesin light chain [Beauveria bassiana]